MERNAKNVTIMSCCTLCMVIYNPQLRDYGATSVTRSGISMHDTSLCCKDSPSKDVLCHTWNYFHAWHVTLLQGQPIKIWIFGGKASSAQGLNTKPKEHTESKVIWDSPYYFLLQVWKRCLVFLLISDHPILPTGNRHSYNRFTSLCHVLHFGKEDKPIMNSLGSPCKVFI